MYLPSLHDIVTFYCEQRNFLHPGLVAEAAESDCLSPFRYSYRFVNNGHAFVKV